MSQTIGQNAKFAIVALVARLAIENAHKRITIKVYRRCMTKVLNACNQEVIQLVVFRAHNLNNEALNDFTTA